MWDPSLGWVSRRRDSETPGRFEKWRNKLVIIELLFICKTAWSMILGISSEVFPIEYCQFIKYCRRLYNWIMSGAYPPAIRSLLKGVPCIVMCMSAGTVFWIVNYIIIKHPHDHVPKYSFTYTSLYPDPPKWSCSSDAGMTTTGKYTRPCSTMTPMLRPFTPTSKHSTDDHNINSFPITITIQHIHIHIHIYTHTHTHTRQFNYQESESSK